MCILGILKSHKTNSMARLEEVTLSNFAMLLCFLHILSNVVCLNSEDLSLPQRIGVVHTHLGVGQFVFYIFLGNIVWRYLWSLTLYREYFFLIFEACVKYCSQKGFL